MKKLFLIIPILATSIDLLSSECAPALTTTKLQLAPYIYQIINANIDGAYKLEELQELVGMEVSGLHRFYPKRANHQEQTLVTGKIADIKPFKTISPGKTIYQMIIHSKKHGLGQFLFSGTYSPAFSTLETTSIPRNTPLGTSIENAVAPSFEFLSIGLDTPPEVAAYKNHLHQQKAVVFHGQTDPFYEFSNSYKIPIVIDREIWPSVIHYVEAQKLANAEDGNEFFNKHVMAIRLASSPEEAVRMARDRSHSLRSDWEEVKDEIMLKALTAKFTQHKHLYDKLMPTGNALIVQHTGEDLYWGDGENGRGQSMLGNLLMKLRDQLRRKVMHGHEHPMVAIRDQLLIQMKGVSEEHSNLPDAYNLARQIASADIDLIEKIDRIQTIFDVAHFFRISNRYPNHTTSDEAIALISKKYPDDTDADFRYQLVRIAVSIAGPLVILTDLRPLNISDNQKIEIYKMMARQSPEFFMRALPYRFGLGHSEMRELYLHALQFESSVLYIKELPREIVDDAFIQDVVKTLNENHIPAQKHASIEEHHQRCEKVITNLIEAAAHHGLRYNPIYTTYRLTNNAANLPCRIDLAKID